MSKIRIDKHYANKYNISNNVGTKKRKKNGRITIMKQLKKTAILLVVLLLCFGALPASAQKKFDNERCLNLIRYYMGEMEGAMYEKGERLLENGNCQKYTFGSWTRNACYGEVTFQQHQELNEKVYWSLDIINPAND
ncbi:MAG: hypothetical protein RR379_09855, partial [Clostridia bacterium]